MHTGAGEEAGLPFPGCLMENKECASALSPATWALFSTMRSIPVRRAGTKDRTNTRHGSQQCGCPRPEGRKVLSNLKSTPSQGAAKPERRHRGWASSRKFPPLQCPLWKIPRGIQGCKGSPGRMVWGLGTRGHREGQVPGTREGGSPVGPPGRPHYLLEQDPAPGKMSPKRSGEGRHLG